AVDQQGLVGVELAQRRGQVAGLGVRDREVADDDDVALGCAQAQRRAHRTRAGLLVDRELVAARARSVDLTAAAEDVDATRAVPGAAGALLLEHLRVGPVDLPALLDFGRTGAGFGALPTNDLPQEMLLDLGREHLVGDVDLVDAVAFQVEYFELGHGYLRS